MSKYVFVVTMALACVLHISSFGQSVHDSVTFKNAISLTGLNGLISFSEQRTKTKGGFGGVEVAYKVNMRNNSSDWVSKLNVLGVDFAFSYRNLENIYLTNDPRTKGFIGNAYSIVSRLNLSLLELGKVNFQLSPGLGLTYVTKTFYTNYNPLIGSHLNVAAEIALNAGIPITNTTTVRAGIDFFHFSNAAFKLPNEGVNTISATVGVVHDIDDLEKPKYVVAFNINRKSSFDIGIGIGHRGLIQVFAQKLSVTDSTTQAHASSHLNNMGFYAGYNYRLNSLISLKAATDIIYYFVTYNHENYLTTVQEYGTSEDRLSTGISLGGDLWLGRLAIEANYGYYLHLKYATTPIHFYNTFGGKYFFTQWVAFEAKLYVHKTEAHYANFGLLFNIK